MLLLHHLSGMRGGAAASTGTLSAFTATALYKGVEFDVTTNETSGTLYYVVVPTAATAPNGAQIKAGTDGSDTAATVAGSIPVAGAETNFDVPRDLADSTAYDIYVVQETGDFSNVVTQEFTTPSTIASGGYDGTAGDLSVTGNAVLLTNQADSASGTNAVALTDDGGGGTGQVIAQFNPITWNNGVSYGEFIFRKVGGAFDAIRLRGLNTTTVPITAIDVSDGSNADGATPWDSLVVTDLGGGFFHVEFSVDMTGDPDRVGTLYIQLLQAGSTNVSRSGAQELMLHNVFVSSENA